MEAHNSLQFAADSMLVTATDLRVRIGDAYPVDGVSFAIAPGETLVLLGESGCGKSLTALAVLGLLPAGSELSGGRIEYRGHDLSGFNAQQRRRVRGRHIAMIFQEPMSCLNPVLTVGEQVEEAVRLHQGLKRHAARERVIELLTSVGIGDAARRMQDYPHQLSGGMKQRVMIAIALAGDPELLIADEPTTALDVTIQAQILELLAALRAQRDMALLLITHDLGVAAQIADRVAVMYAGQIVEQGPCEAFFKAPVHPYSQMLFQALPDLAQRGHMLAAIPGQVPDAGMLPSGCRFADRCDRRMDRCTHEMPAWYGTVEWGVRCLLGEHGAMPPAPISIDPPKLAPRSQAGDVLLEVRDLRVRFDVKQGFARASQELIAVDQVSFDLPVARTLALVGESGCGKSTVAKAVLQLIRPDSGSVRFAGRTLGILQDEALRRARAGFQLIFQDPFASLNPRMRIRDMFLEAFEVQEIGHDTHDRQARAVELMQLVGLRPHQLLLYPHQFSGGQRQRLCIARALAVNPRLVVCDEPTSALDVSVQAQILNLLQRLQSEQNLSYLFISHDLSVVGYLADEVAVMYLGRIVERGPAETILTEPRHPYTQALLAAVPSARKLNGEKLALGDIPSPITRPSGCHFHTRCPHAQARCKAAYPEVYRLAAGHEARCFLLEKEAVTIDAV